MTKLFEKAALHTVAISILCVVVLMICSCARTAQKPPETGLVEELKIRQYNTLGRTGLKVSDIGLGAAGTTDPTLVEYALDLGINYIDTAESYAGGQSETTVGMVAADRRDEMVICTKLDMNGNTTEEEVFERLDACLQRLQTDHVDILMIHGGSQDAVQNPAIYAAFDKLKQQGKIRFTGVSHHGPDIAAELRPVIEENKLDVILCSYDPVGDPEIPAMLEEARKKGIGLVAMKVFPSAQSADLPEFTSGKYPFHLAALRWALKESGMHTTLVSLNMMDQVDEYIQVSGAARQ
ncbi:aldo/keto reductase [Candidatus Eisenbacteria bacterium]|uniref:Aldo/keto reductase n=1 Tax=Eiseniibacteriota bacterium TaxID=2212470 RepID=A0ABV6YJ35_UNCEI